MSERLLLNLLLSLTQVFGYQLIMFHGSYERNRRQAQFLMGGVSGISCVLCMMFPVAMGTHFLWDLRWPVFLLSVLYGGFRGGAICAAMMLSYRAYLGGLISWIMVALDVIVLFLMMMYYRKYIDNNQGKQQRLLWNVIIGLGTYLWVELSIYLYFLWNHDSAFFLHQGMHFYITYGIVTVFAYVSSIVLIESIFTQVAMRKDIAQAEKISLIGDLAASVAHEIRNPLTVAKGFVQLLGTSMDAKREKYISLATSEMDRAEAIISDYLHFAKPQVDKLQKNSVDKLLENVIATMSPFAMFHDVVLQPEFESDLCIYIDKYKFKQVMVNLLKNSIEASPNRGTVFLSVKKHRDTVTILVKDSGVGMSPEQLSRLGKPFYSTKSKGTGLGLMVTFRLVEGMKGKLNFQSELGVGTQTILEFPLHQ